MNKPREEVIAQLANCALKAMDNEGIVDLTAAEVISAIFTLAKNVTMVLIQASAGAELEHNRQEIRDAVSGIYDLVAPKSVN